MLQLLHLSTYNDVLAGIAAKLLHPHYNKSADSSKVITWCIDESQMDEHSVKVLTATFKMFFFYL